jgi:NAD-dependent dihydropyrimidine dehydrogenase PreA subunit
MFFDQLGVDLLIRSDLCRHVVIDCRRGFFTLRKNNSLNVINDCVVSLSCQLYCPEGIFMTWSKPKVVLKLTGEQPRKMLE